MSEVHFNTPEQVAGYMSVALDILDALELDDELRPIVFEKAIDLLSAKQVAVNAAAFAPPILTAQPMTRREGNSGH